MHRHALCCAAALRCALFYFAVLLLLSLLSIRIDLSEGPTPQALEKRGAESLHFVFHSIQIGLPYPFMMHCAPRLLRSFPLPHRWYCATAHVLSNNLANRAIGTHRVPLGLSLQFRNHRVHMLP
ncbi:unnamed protein product [Periconia digitata]|uniref:Uncharacterized protein n=1 Tax=Periconia digitata TaxID=1303443 RepID=A0A9W4U3K0_9PLEO|nr:unnamed protein product [Periconia digitata]